MSEYQKVDRLIELMAADFARSLEDLQAAAKARKWQRMVVPMIELRVIADVLSALTKAVDDE